MFYSKHTILFDLKKSFIPVFYVKFLLHIINLIFDKFSRICFHVCWIVSMYPLLNIDIFLYPLLNIDIFLYPLLNIDIFLYPLLNIYIFLYILC